MRRRGIGILAIGVAALVASAVPAVAADDSRVKSATGEVETGAKKIREGEVGKGVEQTAKGVGHTVVEGAKYTGEKFRESGEAATPPARTGWQKVKDGAYDFGTSVRTFFTSLFNR